MVKKLNMKTKNMLRATQIVNIVQNKRQTRPRAKTGLQQSNDSIVRHFHHYTPLPAPIQQQPVKPDVEIGNLQRELSELKRHPFLHANNTGYFENLRAKHNDSSRKNLNSDFASSDEKSPEPKNGWGGFGFLPKKT